MAQFTDPLLLTKSLHDPHTPGSRPQAQQQKKRSALLLCHSRMHMHAHELFCTFQKISTYLKLQHIVAVLDLDLG